MEYVKNTWNALWYFSTPTKAGLALRYGRVVFEGVANSYMKALVFDNAWWRRNISGEKIDVRSCVAPFISYPKGEDVEENISETLLKCGTIGDEVESGRLFVEYTVRNGNGSRQSFRTYYEGIDLDDNFPSDFPPSRPNAGEFMDDSEMINPYGKHYFVVNNGKMEVDISNSVRMYVGPDMDFGMGHKKRRFFDLRVLLLDTLDGAEEEMEDLKVKFYNCVLLGGDMHYVIETMDGEKHKISGDGAARFSGFLNKCKEEDEEEEEEEERVSDDGEQKDKEKQSDE
jgi:hypothetical protein